ncbi:MAG: thioredoxin [Oscillospiraceae bacterium]|nr:thioredoxin [Oscillospiraceae bacterium]
MLQQIETAEQFSALLEQPLVVVDFYADWCMPCRMMAPVMEKLADAYDGQAAVAKLNIDGFQSLAAQYGIMSIPALVFFKNGEPVQTVVGVKPYEEVEAVLKGLLIRK